MCKVSERWWKVANLLFPTLLHHGVIFEVGDGNDAEFDGLFQSWCDNMRMDAMADSIILQGLYSRYGITAYVWQPLLQCIMRTLKRSSILQPIVFHPQGGRTSTNAYMPMCNLHFEPLHATKKINYRAPRCNILIANNISQRSCSAILWLSGGSHTISPTLRTALSRV